MDTIDIVRRAREDVLANPDKYDYEDWSRCAVGHIYKQATGSYGDGSGVRISQDPNFRAVLRDINKAIGMAGDSAIKLSDRAVPPTVQDSIGGLIRQNRGPLAVKAAVEAYDAVLEVMDKAHDRSLDA